MNEQTSLAHATAAALVRMISEGKTTAKAVGKSIGQSEEKISHILTDDQEALSPAYLVQLFRDFDLSPVFLLTQQGEPSVTSERDDDDEQNDQHHHTSRVLKALNYVISQNGISSLPEYYRLLSISSIQEYVRLCQGRETLPQKSILDLAQVYKINPVYIYNPIPHTPMFL